MNEEEDIKAEIDSLIRDIKFYNNLYFEKSISLISDFEYDNLVKRLEILEKKYPKYKRPDSPTNYVDEKTTNVFEKYKHDIPMLSLKKTYSFEDVSKFFTDVKKINENITFFCELKLDGISINVNYKYGKLCYISTRGDGHVGDDITCNKFLFKNIPDEIIAFSNINDVNLRGEALMTLSDFNDLNKELVEKGFKTLANPRNAASGSLKSLTFDPNEPKRKITIFFYDVFFENRLLKIKKRVEMNAFLKRINVPLESNSAYCSTEKDVFDFIKKYEHEKDRLDYPTDGIVIKVNELDTYDTFGATNKSPRWAIAFKYKPSAVCSKLINVEYQVGRSGIVTPIANFEPIKISGTIVQRASLYNKQNILKLDLHEGDTLMVQKSGEIIPKIIGVDFSKRLHGAKKIEFIEKCPECQDFLKEDNGLYYCKNQKCISKIIGELTHFTSKDAMNIKTLGNKLITLLVKNGLVKNYKDLYTLEFKDVVRLPGMNVRSTQKLFEEIEKSKKVPFYRFLFALGINGVGIVAAKNISKFYKNIEELKHASFDDLIKIDLIGDEIAKNILLYVCNYNYNFNI